LFPSVNELRAKFAEARYIVEEDTIRQVYLGGVMQKPILIEGPPGCGKPNWRRRWRWRWNQTGEAPMLPGHRRGEGARPVRSALQKLFLETQSDQLGTGWESIRTRLHTLDFFVQGPLDAIAPV